MASFTERISNYFKRPRTDDLPTTLQQPQDTQQGLGQEAAIPTATIGKEQLMEAERTLTEYKRGKNTLEQRIVDNERWFRLMHWDLIRKTTPNPGDPEPASAWLLNGILNKHADCMDNYPEPNVLPREESDKQLAEQLSSILPVVLEQNEFEQTYSDAWWYKLWAGTTTYGVFWDKTKLNGLGDISILEIDLLNLFWEPGIKKIQKSRNLFHVELVDGDILEQRYPQMQGKAKVSTIDIKEYYHDDTVDTSKKAAVIDWYYKVNQDGRDVLHYCKFCNLEVLYSSEDDPNYAERGFYDHGKYPFVPDVLYPLAGSLAGFGFVDICKSAQIYIDKLDQAILKTAVWGARPRFWVRGDGKVNEEEYADLTKDFVHYSGSGDPNEDITQIPGPQLDAMFEAIRQNKIEELNETSGNRDWNQGGTTGGVTAASAIAALQEAGSKLSRDMNKSAYRAHAQICYFCIELMRQFYQEDRMFRITNKQGSMQFVQFNGQDIAPQHQGIDFGVDTGYRMPVFDIEISPQKSSPFSTMVENERAKELFAAGFFNPELADQALVALEMMQFEGVETVRQKISQNSMLFRFMQQIAPLMLTMAQQLDTIQGTQYTPQIAQMLGSQFQSAQIPAGGGNGSMMQTNSLGDAFQVSKQSTAGDARARVARNSTPE